MWRVRLSRSTASAVAAAFLLGAVASPARAATNTQIDFAVCPNITTTTYFGAFAGPSGCGPPAFSPGAVIIPPGDNPTCNTPAPNADLGSFLTTQNPLGVFLHLSGGESCVTIPPNRGTAPDGGSLTISVVQRGFCPATLTIPTPSSRRDSIAYPIGTLPFGSYRVTVSFPDQNGWIGSQASGTLHVGTTFTETDTSALVKPGTFAVLLKNSVAGPGAGEFVWTKTTRSSAELKGTDYYACGTIKVDATLRFRNRPGGGTARLTGKGVLAGGTGNYDGIRGAFAVTGSYSAKTGRGRLVFEGTATY